MTKASDNEFPKVILKPLGLASAPADASWKLYPMADGVYARSSNSIVGPLGAGGGGSVATDVIWDAAGDLAVGTGANTAARVAIGAAGTLLKSNGTTAAWALPTFRGVRAVGTGSGALTTGAWTALAFAGADAYDTDAFHDPATNNTRITIPAGLGGYYRLTAGINWTDPSTVVGFHLFAFWVNGAQIQPEQGVIYSNNAFRQAMTLTTEYFLSATDYVEARHYFDTAATLDRAANIFTASLIGV